MCLTADMHYGVDTDSLDVAADADGVDTEDGAEADCCWVAHVHVDAGASVARTNEGKWCGVDDHCSHLYCSVVAASCANRCDLVCGDLRR